MHQNAGIHYTKKRTCKSFSLILKWPALHLPLQRRVQLGRGSTAALRNFLSLISVLPAGNANASIGGRNKHFSVRIKF